MIEHFETFLNDLDVIDLQPSEYVLFRFSTENYNVEAAVKIFKLLQDKFPQNTIICYPDDTSLEFFDKERLLEWIERIRGMITVQN